MYVTAAVINLAPIWSTHTDDAEIRQIRQKQKTA